MFSNSVQSEAVVLSFTRNKDHWKLLLVRGERFRLYRGKGKRRSLVRLRRKHLELIGVKFPTLTTLRRKLQEQIEK